MKKLSWWAVVCTVVVAAVVAGCGSGSSNSSSASIRLANGTLTHPTLDLYVNAATTPSITDIAADTVSAYVATSSGVTTLQVADGGTNTALVTTVPTLTGNDHYILLAYESSGAVKLALLNEDYVAPTAGTAQLRIYDTAIDAGKVDVYVTDPSTDLSTVTAPTLSISPVALSSLVTYSPGTYRVRVTGYGNKNDLRLDIPSFTLASQQIGTVVLEPSTGGVLLNGATVIQQGAYAATRNTNTRVRLAAAVSALAKVAASATSPAGTVTIDGGSVAPAFGSYALVPSASALNISVNGNSVAAPATALVAGSDQTLLVYGAAAGATATLITDDNRLPTDATTVKLRLINGITGTTGSTGLLTLTANAALVASGIGPGLASGYTSVPASVNPMTLKIRSSAAAGDYITDSSNTLAPKTVYTVLAGGDSDVPSTASNAPQMLVQ